MPCEGQCNVCCVSPNRSMHLPEKFWSFFNTIPTYYTTLLTNCIGRICKPVLYLFLCQVVKREKSFRNTCASFHRFPQFAPLYNQLIQNRQIQQFQHNLRIGLQQFLFLVLFFNTSLQSNFLMIQITFAKTSSFTWRLKLSQMF